MPIYKPTELISFLERLDLKPKKSLSQNFLIDGNIVNKIIKTLDIHDGDTVIEIGPGPGVLTEKLLSIPNIKIIAIEKDKIFASELAKTKAPNLTVIEDDVLNVNFQQFLTSSKLKVVSNLPYKYTTPILTHLLDNVLLFSTITLLVQKEFAQRIVASPKTKEYGSLTFFVKSYTTPKIEGFVSKNSFFPKPKVESAIVVLKIKDLSLPLERMKKFNTFTKILFQKRRKKITSSLKILYPQKDLSIIGENSRVEEFSFEELLNLFIFLEKE